LGIIGVGFVWRPTVSSLSKHFMSILSRLMIHL
jgi:hypothetical protein